VFVYVGYGTIVLVLSITDGFGWVLIHAGRGHRPDEAGINYTTPMPPLRLG